MLCLWDYLDRARAIVRHHADNAVRVKSFRVLCLECRGSIDFMADCRPPTVRNLRDEKQLPPSKVSYHAATVYSS